LNTFTALVAITSGATSTRCGLCADALFTCTEALLAAEAILASDPTNEGVRSLYTLLDRNLRLMEANLMGVENVHH